MFCSPGRIGSEISDRGICDLAAALIQTAKTDFILAYIDVREAEKEPRSKENDYILKRKQDSLEKSLDFFKSRLFANALGAVSNESIRSYISILEKEAQRMYKRYLSGYDVRLILKGEMPSY